MNARHIAWLLLAAGLIIYFIENSSGNYLFSWETNLPGSSSMGLGLGEYLLAGSVAIFVWK